MADRYVLDYPIDIANDGTDVIKDVPLNRLKAKQMQVAYGKKANARDFSNYLISQSTGLTLIEIGELDESDYDGLVDAITPFLSRSGKL